MLREFNSLTKPTFSGSRWSGSGTERWQFL